MKSKLAVAGVAALAYAGSILAQSNNVPSNAVVVTATRTAQTADKTLTAVTVISREEIERSQANDVPELLRGLVGMNVVNQGGYGKLTSVFLRGTSPGHVLVLVDGVKTGSATAGAPTWEFLPIAEIDRIEIVRGPRSSLYGSEAIGGVVQIFTRRGEGAVKPTAKATVGSFHTREVNGGISGGPGNLWFNAHAGRFTTEGFNSIRPSSSSFDPDQDGYENDYGSFRLGYRFAPETDIEAFTLRARGTTEFDSFPGLNDQANFRQNVEGAKLRTRVASAWNTSLQTSASEDKTYNFRGDGASTPTRFNTKRRQQSWQNDFSLGDRQLLTLGLDNEKDLITSTTDFLKTSRENKARFSVYQGSFGDHSLQASVRSDDNEQFGRHETGSVAYGFSISSQYRIFSSYGTGFRAPTFSDLYYPDPVFSTGNPNLKPEKSESVELGIAGESGIGSWTANLFRTRIENLLVLSGPPRYLPINQDRSTINGLELAGATKAEGWDIGANLTLLDPRNDATDKFLQRRSRYTTRFDVDRMLSKTRVGASLIVEGARYSDPENQQRLGGFALLNLRAEQTLSRDWRLTMRVENLLDEDYETVAEYNNLGRALFLSIYFRPTAQTSSTEKE